MDEIYFENDDFFLPNADDESIWHIVDPIIIKEDEAKNKRNLSQISTSSSNNNVIPQITQPIKKPKSSNIIENEIPNLTQEKEEVIFFSNNRDPFAQSSWMVLLEKKIAFRYIEIPNKIPEWFIKLNPEKNVPALKYEETILSDSNIINEFLEDCFTDKTNLLPKSPIEKAKARIIIKKIQELIPLFSELLQSQTLESQTHRGQTLRNKLKEVNEFLAQQYPQSIKGPYLLGNDFSLLDCVLLPFYDRMKILLPHMRNWKIPSTKDFSLLEDWFLRASKRLSFQETRKVQFPKYEDFLIKEYQYGNYNF